MMFRMMHEKGLEYAILLIMVSALLSVCSCLFDSPAPEPGFPSRRLASMAIESPSMVKCIPERSLALVSSGSELVVLDLDQGLEQGRVELGLYIDDISDSSMNGYSWVLADSTVFSVDVSGPGIQAEASLGSGGSYIEVSPGSQEVWVSLEDDSLASVDPSSMDVTIIGDILLKDCQGLATSGDGRLFAALGGEDVIAGYDTSDWKEIGRVSVPGDVLDLFPGPTGYVCAIVQGSNELWYIRTSDCALYRMITFPETPVAAASMPDGDYAYASCSSVGMLVVSENGQVEFRSAEFGIPTSMDISSGGDRAVLCCEDDGQVHILEK